MQTHVHLFFFVYIEHQMTDGCNKKNGISKKKKKKKSFSFNMNSIILYLIEIRTIEKS